MLITETIGFSSDTVFSWNIDPKTIDYFNELQWSFNTSINRIKLALLAKYTTLRAYTRGRIMSNKTRIIILTATVAVSTGAIIGLSAINPFARYAKVLEKGETTDWSTPTRPRKDSWSSTAPSIPPYWGFADSYDTYYFWLSEGFTDKRFVLNKIVLIYDC